MTLLAILGVDGVWTLSASVLPQHTNSQVIARINELYKELIGRDGFGEVTVTVRILKRGQKEVLIRCSKESRYVVDGTV